MADIDAKVNMSLDDIIKMEKKKKTNPKAKHGGMIRGGTIRGGTIRGGMRGTTRSGNRGNIRGNNVRGRNNNNTNNRQNINQAFNKRGQWKKYPQKSVHGGFVKKRFNNTTVKSNLTRSRSNLSLNRINVNSSKNVRGGFPSRQGSKFGLTRSRSRTNLVFTKPTFQAKAKGFLKRTNSMPNLQDPSSVYNRLGYQSPAQVAYRNRVKRAKNVSLQRHNKALRMQNAFSLVPTTNMKTIAINQKQQSPSRRFSTGSLRSDQVMRAQRRAQYEQKLMRIGAARANNSVAMSIMKAAYDVNQRHPAMALYPTTIQTQNPVVLTPRQLQRGRSPFKQNLQGLKAVTKTAGRSASYTQRQQKRARSRSRSRARPNNSIINLTDAGDLEDRSFSEVMYSLSNKFGVTGRTLNDRFSLF